MSSKTQLPFEFFAAFEFLDFFPKTSFKLRRFFCFTFCTVAVVLVRLESKITTDS